MKITFTKRELEDLAMEAIAHRTKVEEGTQVRPKWTISMTRERDKVTDIELTLSIGELEESIS